MLAGVALEVKEGLARQALLPVCRAEAALNTSSAFADAKPCDFRHCYSHRGGTPL